MRFTRRSAPELEASHLILPVNTDLLKLAQVWYADARWLVDPAAARANQKSAAPVGARFAGQIHDEPAIGRLMLTPEIIIEGPLPAKEAALWIDRLPEDHQCRHDSEVFHFPAAALEWVRAVARRMDGAVITNEAVEVGWVASTKPDFRLYSPQRLTAEEAVSVIRDALPAAQLVWTDTDSGQGLTSAFAIRHETPYDGGVLVRFDQAEGAMPAALKDADWHTVGPNIFHLGWVPAYDESATVPHDGVGLTAADSAAWAKTTTWISRALRVLQARLGGSILDSDGFVVDDVALRRLGLISQTQAATPTHHVEPEQPSEHREPA